MKKNLIILAAAVLIVIIGIFAYMSKQEVVPVNEDISIIAPLEGARLNKNEYPIVFVQGTATPGESVYIYQAKEACITSATRPLAGGGVSEEGSFSVGLSGLNPGTYAIKVVSVSTEEEQAHRDSCYSAEDFSREVTFTYTE